jgi:hypothetical protein
MPEIEVAVQLQVDWSIWTKDDDDW